MLFHIRTSDQEDHISWYPVTHIVQPKASTYIGHKQRTFLYTHFHWIHWMLATYSLILSYCGTCVLPLKIVWGHCKWCTADGWVRPTYANGLQLYMPSWAWFACPNQLRLVPAIYSWPRFKLIRSGCRGLTWGKGQVYLYPEETSSSGNSPEKCRIACSGAAALPLGNLGFGLYASFSWMWYVGLNC